ncbi:L,D-transpeptidase [bacterium]|nr:MAG: L,D-transpeptidase [bacterium]
MKGAFPKLLLLFTGVIIILAIVLLQSRAKVTVVPDVELSDSLIIELPEDSVAAAKVLKQELKLLSQLQPKGLYIVVDTHANFLELRTEDSVIHRAPCSTGSGGELLDTLSGRRWEFRTPRGKFKVQSKLVQPWWRKPDWAFIEEGEPIPKRAEDRFDSEVLGDYALGFGDGYFIHGTLYTRLIGINVTHGCVRLADEDLKIVYNRAQAGTPVYVF